MNNIKLISYNMNQRADSWQTVLDSGIDAAMLQEAKPPPNQLKDKFVYDREGEWLIPGLSFRAAVAGVAESRSIEFAPIKTQPLDANDPYALKVSLPGSLAAAGIRIKDTGEEITIVSLYSTWMKPIRQTDSSWIFADGSTHRLLSDLSGLIGSQKGHKIIVAGDLNILYGYGESGSHYWKARYDTVFERIKAMGLCFIGPQAPEGGRQAKPWPEELPPDSMNVPTFYHNQQRPETASRQLDYVFASQGIAERVTVKALNSIEEWGPSDHCRILIELKK